MKPMPPSDPVAVTAAVLTRNGNVLLARRPLGDRLAGKWEFPGGKVETGETARACLERELYEEFRIRASIGAFLGESVYHYDHISVRLLVFHAVIGDEKPEPTAHSEYCWVPLDRLLDYDLAPADIPVASCIVDGHWSLPER